MGCYARRADFYVLRELALEKVGQYQRFLRHLAANFGNTPNAMFICVSEVREVTSDQVSIITAHSTFPVVTEEHFKHPPHNLFIHRPIIHFLLHYHSLYPPLLSAFTRPSSGFISKSFSSPSFQLIN
jgi:hypothetical protein